MIKYPEPLKINHEYTTTIKMLLKIMCRGFG